MNYAIHITIAYSYYDEHLHHTQVCMYPLSAQLTSVFKDRPLLKKIVETAMYFTVISGLRGPVAYKYIAY